MKKVKTRHKETGKIEIFDEFIAEQNSSLEIIEEGDHLEEEQETVELRDKEEMREARRRRKMRKQSKNKKTSTKKRTPKRLGYGEDEGEDQGIRLRGRV